MVQSWTSAHASAGAAHCKTDSRLNQSELPQKNKHLMNARFTTCKAGLPKWVCVLKTLEEEEEEVKCSARVWKNVRLSPLCSKDKQVDKLCWSHRRRNNSQCRCYSVDSETSATVFGCSLSVSVHRGNAS